KVDCSVINAGDGSHEHPTQALLDALTIRRNKGRIERLVVAICGDILHSRVARSNIILLNALGSRVRVVAPSTLLPPAIERFGVEATRDMREGLRDADIVMMMLTERRPILLANARILDPSRDLDIDGDLLIADGVIREAKRGIGAAGVPEATEVIDCKGKLVAPGLVDMRAFIGEPGAEYR